MFSTAASGEGASRYVSLGRIGAGGMGEVFRVLDKELGRELAMKVLREELARNPESVARFMEEAQATAQLQHPGIVPVYDVGRLPDGRPWFTMKEVRGQTLSAVIHEVHSCATGQEWCTTPGGWSLRRLIEGFKRVCDAVAYAHSRGVLHRDLKPANIMVGEFGEVVVMDWGLVRVRPGASTVVTGRSTSGMETLHGTISGTPAYMAPEQAAAAPASVRSDVYSMGAILYEILSGAPPYEGPDAGVVLAQVLMGPPLPVGGRTPAGWMGGETLAWEPQAAAPPSPAPTPQARSLEHPPIPAELQAITERAMAREPGERYPDVGALGEEVASWLDDAWRREHARAQVEQALPHHERAAALEEQASQLEWRARALAARLAPAAPIEEKRSLWRLEDQIQQLHQEAELSRTRYVHTLEAALTFVATYPPAMDRLADFYAERHREAEGQRRSLEAQRFGLLLAAYDRGRYAAYRRGEGALSLETDPPGALVTLLRYEEEDRRLVARPFGGPLRAPVRAHPLPVGSWLAVIEMPGHHPVKYPFLIEREGHWDGVPPEGGPALPIPLPREGELGPGDVYVPAGWFWRAPDPAWSDFFPRHRVWLDAFVIKRHAVTNGEYLAFVNALVREGVDPGELLRYLPRERGGSFTAETGPIVRSTDGQFHLGPDSDGDVWRPEWGLRLIDWRCALAYAAWCARMTGQPWRLPFDAEWHKAAAGVDQRPFPFGYHVDPTWIDCQDSQGPRSLPRPADQFPLDESPYGACGMAGGQRDWLMDLYQAELPLPQGGRLSLDAYLDAPGDRSARGGSFASAARSCRIAARGPLGPGARSVRLGMRLARAWRPGER